MRTMAGRKRHSAEDNVRKLRRADELAAEARPVRRSPPTWRCQRRLCATGAVSTAAWTLTRRKPQGLAGAERPAQAAVGRCRVGEGRAAIDMLKDVMNMSERKACKVVGPARSVYRQPQRAQTLADPDAGLREQLRTYARKNPGMGSVGPGHGCASTKAMRSTTRRRRVGCGSRKGCRCAGRPAANVLASRRCRSSFRMRQRCCGHWTLSSIPSSTDRRSRSRRWSTSTPGCRC